MPICILKDGTRTIPDLVTAVSSVVTRQTVGQIYETGACIRGLKTRPGTSCRSRKNILRRGKKSECSVGASSSNSNDITFTKNFYLGYPPSMDLANTSGFVGCALFFEGIARNLPLNSVTEYGPVTYGQTLQDACVNDLMSQAKTQVQMLGSTNDLDNRSVYTALQTIMEASPPQSCQTIATVTWGTIVRKEITGPHVSSGTKYNIALIETPTNTSEGVSRDITPFSYSITPVLTVFYSASAPSNAQGKALPEAHPTCVTVVEGSTLVQQSNDAGMMGLPRSMIAFPLGLSILALV
ncbi:hypothetical protein AYL99_11599 [Fonsecaea erecta]|uniref:Uncharacterized protein n=1 Tax=Fonsecaea erecta TaxID=1367422 RepID=A0A178Z4Q1_9EURO|nr:hypothetical protein AYL99_11599 [Fonsecaea erecta]OAP54065.1 hypothetical protein AYL99_11599 [Fonsecaea erecta]